MSKTNPYIPEKPIFSPIDDSTYISKVTEKSTDILCNQLMKYKVTLKNHQQKDYEIPAGVINQLCIEDDLLFWPLRGYIIIDNVAEVFERGKGNDFYFLRADARDELHIEMYPVIENGELPDKIWKIKCDMIVYDVEDLPHKTIYAKQKKLYFWDKRYHELQEKNIQWSTATDKRYTQFTKNPPCPSPVSHTSDIQRSMFTGEAIASILEKAGYENIIDFDEWDWGKGRINISSKSGWTIWETIQYILQKHVSSQGPEDICVLKWDRHTQKLQLIPYWKIFSGAGSATPGNLQIEHMFFEEFMGDDNISVTPFKSPININENSKMNEIDIKADGMNKIVNYRFSQMSGQDNCKAFITKPVFSYEGKRKQFNVDVKENEIKTVRDLHFKKNYVEKLLTIDKQPIMALNKTKTEAKSVNPVYSLNSGLDPILDRSIRSNEGKGKILYAGIYLNHSLSLRMLGSTHRLSGTFIGVDRITQDSDNIYDYQICGQYLVVNVKHIIHEQNYANDLVMQKIHSYKDLLVNEEIE